MHNTLGSYPIPVSTFQILISGERIVKCTTSFQKAHSDNSYIDKKNSMFLFLSSKLCLRIGSYEKIESVSRLLKKGTVFFFHAEFITCFSDISITVNQRSNLISHIVILEPLHSSSKWNFLI